MAQGKKLEDSEVRQRMAELSNLRLLHARDRQRIAKVVARNKELRQENQELRKTLESLQVQIAELQTMVFGKRRRPPTGHAAPPELPRPIRLPRTKASYRRPPPPANAITAEKSAPLPGHCPCGGKFGHVTTHDRYQEDIPLPDLTKDYRAHLVTRYRVEHGVCDSCGKASAGKDLGGQQVALGPNVRLLTAHLVAAVGLSYSQVKQLFNSLYGLSVSDGEIARMLNGLHKAWLPAYEQLTADIRASPVRHYDETSWKIVEGGGGYAWVMSAADSPEVVFKLAESRGRGHAQALHGDANGVFVTDAYGAYHRLPGKQQLCWAHLYRVIRDLKYNEHVPPKQLPYVSQWYEEFAKIYQDLRSYLEWPYARGRRWQQRAQLWARVYALASQPPPKSGEPAKLTRLKNQLLRVKERRLFTCLTKDTPCDNNRAERDLRPLVLKRKRSFGSKSHQGAAALSTVLSLCTTLWRKNPDTYFQALQASGT